MNFDAAFDKLLGHEGGYANHPSDPGGETMWGVTKRVAIQSGYTGPMRQMPRETAKAIYRKLYWDAVRADELPEALRFDVFDAAVNSGAKQSVKWLQRVLNVEEDGLIGPETIAATKGMNPVAVAAAMNGERLDLMTSLPTWGAFGRGWARRIADNLKSLVR